MRIVVLGAGMQGTACAYDLCLSDQVKEVVIADVDLNRAEASVKTVQAALKNTSTTDRRFKLSAATADVTQHAKLVSFLRGFDVAVSAVPYFYNVGITKACVESETHMVDMGGNTDVVFQQRDFDQQAKNAGICILPDCGLAPGLANILAADAVARLETTHTVEIRVGGLPLHPVAPLNYQLFFSIHGLINEYLGKAVVLENGRRTEVDTLTGLESVYFDAVEEPLEAVITLGGLSTLPWTYEGRVKTLNYKTLRYPGHWALISSMQQLGVFDETPVKTATGATVVPREVFMQLAEPKLTWQAQGGRPEDIVLVRLNAWGERNGKPQTLTYEIVDHYDVQTGFTAMMRMTAFPVSIVAQMLGNKTIRNHGVHTLETTVPTPAFIDELEKRGIRVQLQVNEQAFV